MPDSSTSSPRVRLDAPQPVSPVAGRAVEGRSPTFSWLAVPGADAYRLQIAPEADFEATHLDTTVDDATEITVYDALPDDGSTCYWRVRALAGEQSGDQSGEASDEAVSDDPDSGPWSGVAHFAAHPDDAQIAAEAAAEQDASPTAPTPTRPVDGAPADGQSADFQWDAAPAASGYQVQVAASKDFDAPVVDLTLDRTTSLTLYGMLPDDGSTFHWRVRALLPGRRTSPWSDAARFTAATDDDVLSHQAELEIREQEALERQQLEERHTAAQRAETESPVRSAQTSGWAAIGMAYFTVLTFLATLYLIAQAVT